MIKRLQNWLLDYNIKTLQRRGTSGRISPQNRETLARMINYKEKGHW